MSSEKAITITVRVTPRSSRSEVVGMADGVLRVRLTSPPVDGAANEELVRVLAKAYRVPKSEIVIISGINARTKLVRITGAADQ
jgi:uncharacterized protein (TIGR00251 family)